MNSTFVSKITPPDTLDEPAYWFLFRGFRLLIHEDEEGARVPLVRSPAKMGVTPLRTQYLGYLEQEDGPLHVFSGELQDEVEPPPGMAFHSLRRLFGMLDESCVWLAGRAIQIVNWDRNHVFCGRCGRHTEARTQDRAKECPNCGLSSYPRLSPAIIVAVERPSPTHDGTDLLLARSHRHPPDLYSVLAGFVEPGETLEGCVRREIMEEVGIRVKNIRYFGSQPWPFPDSLMIAFTAEYESGDITLHDDEIHDAGWYTADNLPLVPPGISIARQLIDAFVAKNEANQS